MLPTNRAFGMSESVEHCGKIYYRNYKIERTGCMRLVIHVTSINSPYRQAIAVDFCGNPKFKGTIYINGIEFVPERKRQYYVMPVELPDKCEIVMDLEIIEGYLRLANASDFLDDYPDLIKQISAQTGRTRDQFRGNSYTSGFTPHFGYGNAFWVEEIGENKYRFHCNDHKMDDDYDDIIFELEIEETT